MLVDSHCHLDRLDLTPFGGELTGAIEQANQAGVDGFLCVGIDLESLPAMLELIDGHDNIWASVGVHPNESDGEEPSIDQLVEISNHERIIAIGETGLDYFRSSGDLDWQRDRFRVHIQAAQKCSKPLIIHSREAHADSLEILKQELVNGGTGVMHCYTYGWDEAREYLDLGLYLSFSGIVTFNSARAIQEVAKKIPADRMLIETDAPYLAPTPHRGKPNYPAYVSHVADCISALRGESYESVAQVTRENFTRLFLAK